MTRRDGALTAPDMLRLREDIARDREALGHTVEALAKKVDVRARARQARAPLIWMGVGATSGVLLVVLARPLWRMLGPQRTPRFATLRTRAPRRLRPP